MRAYPWLLLLLPLWSPNGHATPAPEAKTSKEARAIHLRLDALNISGDLEGLERAVLHYLEVLPKDSPLHAELQDILSALEFKKCTTAPCFVAFADRHPKSIRADQALYNALVSYERDKRDQSVIFTAERLIHSYPRSQLTERAFESLFNASVRLADHKGATTAADHFFARFPHTSRAKALIIESAISLSQRGDNVGALKQLSKVSRRYRDPKVYALVGQILEKDQRYQEALKHWHKPFSRARRDLLVARVHAAFCMAKLGRRSAAQKLNRAERALAKDDELKRTLMPLIKEARRVIARKHQSYKRTDTTPR